MSLSRHFHLLVTFFASYDVDEVIMGYHGMAIDSVREGVPFSPFEGPGDQKSHVKSQHNRLLFTTPPPPPLAPFAMSGPRLVVLSAYLLFLPLSYKSHVIYFPSFAVYITNGTDSRGTYGTLKDQNWEKYVHTPSF